MCGQVAAKKDGAGYTPTGTIRRHFNFTTVSGELGSVFFFFFTFAKLGKKEITYDY